MEHSYTKYLFFTGKGGVGKTSLACATAVQLADQAKKVLLISTDPASNLEDVLQTSVGEQIQAHQQLPTLFTINISPDVSAEEYRDRVIQPMMGVASEMEIKQVKEGLSGACTTEIASFDEFSRFITGEGIDDLYDVVIFDTAPTGHTIRLLELPSAWDDFLENNPGGASCIGPSSALKSSKERYKKVIQSLRDPQLTTFYLVSRPEKSSLKEAAKTSMELRELGLENQRLLINGVFKALNPMDPVAQRIALLADKQLQEIPMPLANLPMKTYPLLPYNVLGLRKLRSLLDETLQSQIVLEEIASSPHAQYHIESLKELVNSLEQGQRTSGLIMTMGKGGVGKTIAAATIACLLAERGHKVLLTTTDPAAHINDFLSQLDQIPANLQVERIDPKVETQLYIHKIMAQKGAKLGANERNLLLEDLQSPCTEEVAVFHAFSKAIHSASRQFVVMDTAPTGHTLLLLDTTGSYHKEVLKHSSLSADKIRTPYMALQDKEFAKIILVALPETTPMREAAALQEDLRRAGIEPYAWLINQCLSALPELKDPILKKRASAEGAIIEQIQTKLAHRTFGIPYLTEELVFPELLSM
ncbi:arsenical pump-driving ATPase [Cytophagaceae bacterium 50C-KIRBA]|uniref:arsenite-transporting ATPase n=1 Tax=Aquirufa beregesia TaxID=2516556 RepID=A0ABX0EU35_9BACT|nr:arsenical pump-driving ATPase [Aquirufa beregesia]NGZ42858.1 arsenical pump-driving ATPase [Aquirufa beregesia]